MPIRSAGRGEQITGIDGKDNRRVPSAPTRLNRFISTVMALSMCCASGSAEEGATE